MPRLIDADALMEREGISQFAVFARGSGKTLLSACRTYLQCVIDDAPTIDPEELRPKGRWEMRGGKLYCTHCGERAAVARDSDDFWYTKGTPACPNCGARMEVT